jgi:CRP-like cAMP-binding protein
MQQIEDAIRGSYLVRGMSAEDVNALVAISEPRRFDGGMMLVRQFDRSKDLMIILEGAARVNTFSGDRIIELGPGSVVGEMAMLDDQPRSATVLSVNATTVAFIAGDKLQTLMYTRPGVELALLRNLSRVLCSYIRMANLQLEGQLNKH